MRLQDWDSVGLHLGKQAEKEGCLSACLTFSLTPARKECIPSACGALTHLCSPPFSFQLELCPFCYLTICSPWMHEKCLQIAHMQSGYSRNNTFLEKNPVWNLFLTKELVSLMFLCCPSSKQYSKKNFTSSSEARSFTKPRWPLVHVTSFVPLLALIWLWFLFLPLPTFPKCQAVT